MVYIVDVELFPELPHGWTATDQLPEGAHATFIQRLKLKFECPHCSGRSKWTSMKGTAEFKIWRRHGKRLIMCSIYDQQHVRCDQWAEGDVYNEEFVDLVLAVVEKFSNPDQRRGIKHKNGNPTKNHYTTRCEACAAGKCTEASRD